MIRASVLLGLVVLCSGHRDDWFLRSCGLEVWDDSVDVMANIFKTGECIACFKQVEDPMTEEGLENSKMCTAKWLKVEHGACPEQIEAMTVENFAESVVDLTECFKLTTKKMVAGYCLGRTSSGDVIESLTDGTICTMSLHKNITDFIHFVHQVSGIPDDEPLTPVTDINLKKYMQHTLFPRFYCQAALGKDAETIDSCYECFETAVEENKEDMEGLIKSVTECSESHLLPYFEDCHSGLVSLSEDSELDEKAVEQCYERGVYRHVTTKCTPKAVSATAGGLVNNIDCSVSVFKKMIEENTEPEIASLIIQEVTKILP